LAEDRLTIEEITTEAQMGIFWRILHLLIARYGNHPMGQLLVALTMTFLNERGMPPTLTDLCDATGLPKASVSRYVTWQIKHGFVAEQIDPNDRRRRYLKQTPKGKREWHWQMQQMEKLFSEIRAEAEAARVEGWADTAESLLEKMIDMTANAPERLKRGP
jgi:DNA-binding MarR family transcriptional regulator